MTLFADVKTILDPLVSNRVYRDRRPSAATMPFVTIDPDISVGRVINGDGNTRFARVLYQVNLWQRADDESDALPASIVAALDGGAATEGRRGLRVDSVVRLVDEVSDEDRLVHHAITIAAISPR